MYLRAILDLDDWYDSNSLELNDLPLSCLYTFAEKQNEFSVFKVEKIDDKKSLDYIVLRLFSQSPNKWSKGFRLMILEQSLLDKMSKIEDDKSEYMKCLHANICDATYNDFKLLVEYTYNLCKENDDCGKFIEYTFGDIGNIFNNMTDEEGTEFINSYSGVEKEKKDLKKSIRGKYFQGKKCPAYLL